MINAPFQWYSDLSPDQKNQVNVLYPEDLDRECRAYLIGDKGEVSRYPGTVITPTTSFVRSPVKA